MQYHAHKNTKTHVTLTFDIEIQKACRRSQDIPVCSWKITSSS